MSQPVFHYAFAVDDLNKARLKLPSSFRHDFRKGLPAALFRGGGQTDGSIKMTEQGVAVTRTGIDGFTDTRLIPRLQLHGDFDVIAEFEGLAADLVPNGLSMCELRLRLNDERST